MSRVVTNYITGYKGKEGRVGESDGGTDLWFQFLYIPPVQRVKEAVEAPGFSR